MSEDFKFREHLSELRSRLKVVFGSFVAVLVVVLLLPLNLSQFLNFNAVYWTTPVSLFINSVESYSLPSADWKLIPFHVAAPFEILIGGAFILAFAVDMPVITYELYKFIDPALKAEERRLVYPVIASSTALFLAGLAFGYYFLVKFVFIAMSPFYAAVGLYPPYLIEASDFYTIVFLSVFFSGLAFTSPVFVYLLIKFGVIPPSFFSKYRVWIYVGTYVATAVITPDGGPLLDVILFVPVVALLELAVFLGKRTVPKEEPEGDGWHMDCPHCGKALSRPMLFCEHCGKSIA